MKKVSKRKKNLASLIDRTKKYSLSDAVALVKKTSNVKFDAGIELHIRLGIDPKQADQIVRGTVQLPHGTGKTKRVLVFAEGADAEKASKAGAYKVGGQELVKEIAQTSKIDADVIVAHPSMMKVLGPIAKILGPKGLMPNPKNDTVASDVAKAVKDLAGGKIPFRNDSTGNIHLLLGRASFSDADLLKNLEAVIDAIRRAKPSSSKGTYLQASYLASSMGPSIPISL